jgi:hypothetical protein
LHLPTLKKEWIRHPSIIELHTALRTLSKQHVIPTVSGLSETWESIATDSNYELPGYTYFGKPITRNPGATRDHGGTGAWVINSMYNQSSTIEPEKQHKDILWIQIIDAENITYIAVIYSRPEDASNHEKIMATLKHNYNELSKLGRVVMMGDLNTRITQTTRKVNSQYGVYENQLLNMMNITGLRPLVANKYAIDRDEHWTFVGRNGGRSINDYILVQPSAFQRAGYKVHQGVNLQSQHRLMTATLPY